MKIASSNFYLAEFLQINFIRQKLLNIERYGHRGNLLLENSREINNQFSPGPAGFNFSPQNMLLRP